MTEQTLKTRALSLLKTFYGYSSFRPGQWEVISAVAAGRDTFVIMPTGGGKSLCYQLPALLLDGCVIVVSPLIALMEDQVSALMANGIPAAAIHSGRAEAANREAAEAALDGKVKVLYMSPERLLADLDSWVCRCRTALVAVDEAHCISQWGHDFRPVYTQLDRLKASFPGVPLMALTATADRDTRADISRQLALDRPMMWLGSFNRPNLSLTVVQGADSRRRMAAIEDMIRRYPTDTGIVYTLSREGAERVHQALRRRGFRAALYHAGMSAADREASRQAFSNGDVQAVCATIAFGMGIDKSNIRWVIHNNMPGTIENYYQEIGRAGRDGLPSETILFYSLQDLIMRRKFVEESGRQLVAADKLQRMKEYAESPVCRRRVLLSYFGEAMDHDCGGCDVCLNPPERFDGSVEAQKAMSAILRTDSQVGAYMLVDILRGSARADVRRRGFDHIKTFGAGRDLSQAEWNYYVMQMVQLGLIEVSLADDGHLGVTPYGMKVLRGEEHIQLARYRPAQTSRRQRPQHDMPGVTAPDAALFEYLKTVRRELARRHNIAPYMVLSDASLLDMAQRRPTTEARLLDVSGIGREKARRYGPAFIAAIMNYNRNLNNG